MRTITTIRIKAERPSSVPVAATHTATVSRLLPYAVLAPACLVLALLFSACGKTGYPQAADGELSFTWLESGAAPAGRCASFTGKLGGALQNFGGIRLELEGLNSTADCPGCPFVADEAAELSPADAGFNSTSGEIGFSYCPRPAAAYRWRMIAMSTLNRLPHAVMTDRLLIVSPEGLQ
ncbi:MAG: hypothetical protein LBC55_06940 [Desulfovibrio sp.]|jgi:hypothetical protein|nr:hypothetical protein [Desulfovibrio sp.]